jgi:hypothetical protein
VATSPTRARRRRCAARLGFLAKPLEERDGGDPAQLFGDVRAWHDAAGS